MRLIDVDLYCATICKCNRRECDKAKCPIHNAPTAYDVDKVVEELKEAMQDLSVIEILSHIDFDSTIQSGLDNFLKAYNSELLRIVKHGCASDDVCEWNGEQSRLVTFTRFTTTCGDNIDLQTNSELLKAFRYCPFCGKNIKIVGD